MESEINLVPYDLGKWLGRSQAFRLMAHKCSAADAQCLKAIKDNRSYRSLHISWEEFCEQHAGLSRANADRIIDQLEEFGSSYFHLSELMQISPESYRELAPAVTEDGIEFEGERIPITPENSTRITEVVRSLRTRAERASQALASERRLRSTQTLFRRCVAQLSGIKPESLEPEDRAALANALDNALIQLMTLSENLRA